jgi:class 3 adenylate cyclase/tetratricopeptide (TPR) repeat protein
MTFEEILDQAIVMLQRRGRLTYRALQRQFALDDAYLEDLKAELIQGQQLAVDEEGAVLVWTGDRASVPSAPDEPAPSLPPGREAAPAPGASTPPSHGTSDPHTTPILAGERRQVTVLFADISGFTALAETMDPEDVRQVMNACFAQLVPVVETYGGTIDKFIGDEIMALFGAPIAYDNDAERAVRAALAMQEALAAFNTAQGTTLGLHCGLNTGLVIAGGIGAASRQDYSVMGDAVNLAARLEDASERGQIFVGPETYHLTHALFRYEPLAPMMLKGKTAPVQVYQVLGLRDVLETHETDTSTGLPLVGRASELALLLDRWAQATQGAGHVVVLSGEAGIGKSRLVAALGERVVQEGHRRITIRCSPYHTNSALHPIIVRLERLLQGPGEELAAAQVERLERLLHPTGLPLERIIPLIAALVSVPLPEGRYTPLRLSPQQQKQQTLEALVTWLVAEATPQPVLSVWEDLHWADPSTLELLDLLLRQVPTARILVMVTCRPAFQPPWGVRSYFTPLMLSRLGPPQIAQMIDHLTAGKALPPEVMGQVMTKTDGVPLFIEECVKMVLESSLVRAEDGQYVLTGPLPPFAIPPTLQEALMARLDQLAPGKAVAHLGATVGREFAYELLAAVSPLDEPVLQHGLAQLVDAELLYQQGHLPHTHYIFKHALIQETAYQSLLRSTRQQYHQRIAQVLEGRFPETVQTQPALVAQHYTAAGLQAQALPYWHQAGARAYDRAAFREAVAAFEQALQALAHLPEHGETQELAIDLRLALVRALSALGAYERGLALLGEAESLSRTFDDRARLGRVLIILASEHLETGDLNGAIAAGQQALALATALGESALQVQASYSLGRAYRAIGDFGQSAALLRQTMEAADQESGTSSIELRLRSRASLAITLSALGALAEGQRHGEEALRLAVLEGRGSTPIMAHSALGHVYLNQGELEHAIRVLEQGLALCRASGNRDWLRFIVSDLGYASALQGRLAEGHALLEEAISESISTGGLHDQAYALIRLSEVCRLLGQGEEAWQHACQALDVARQQQERGSEALALHQLGVVQAHATPPDIAQAEAHYQQALALTEALDMRPLQAHCHLGLGRLYSQTGRGTQARAALSTALELYRAMDMTFWLPQAEAALAQAERQ